MCGQWRWVGKTREGRVQIYGRFPVSCEHLWDWDSISVWGAPSPPESFLSPLSHTRITVVIFGKDAVAEFTYERYAGCPLGTIKRRVGGRQGGTKTSVCVCLPTVEYSLFNKHQLWDMSKRPNKYYVWLGGVHVLHLRGFQVSPRQSTQGTQ